MSKPWYASRTIWANALVGTLAVLETQIGLLQPHLRSGVYTALAIGLPVLNVWLRTITSQPVTARAGRRWQ